MPNPRRVTCYPENQVIIKLKKYIFLVKKMLLHKRFDKEVCMMKLFAKIQD